MTWIHGVSIMLGAFWFRRRRPEGPFAMPERMRIAGLVALGHLVLQGLVASLGSGATPALLIGMTALAGVLGFALTLFGFWLGDPQSPS